MFRHPATICYRDFIRPLVYRMFEKQKNINDERSRHGLFRGGLPVNLTLVAVLVIVFVGSLFLGRYTVDPGIVVQIIISGILETIGNIIYGVTGIRLSSLYSIEHTWPSVANAVVWNVRLPRALAVILVGSGLAVSGAVFQGTFRNPLVSESILGVSAGASVGAAIGILIGYSGYTVQLFAFAFGLLAVTMTYLISRVYNNNPTLVLVLAGIVVGGLFSAATSLIKYVADPYLKLPDIVFWLMGSFGKVGINDVYMVAPVLLICMIVLLLLRWRLNVLSMGDEEARSIGLDTKKLRFIVILAATLITSAAVCISGLVGWVGLIIPQMARMLVGPDHKTMLPATLLLGASYLLIVDTICRDLTATEIPVSIVTSFLGAPIFLYLLKKAKESW